MSRKKNLVKYEEKNRHLNRTIMIVPRCLTKWWCCACPYVHKEHQQTHQEHDRDRERVVHTRRPNKHSKSIDMPPKTLTYFGLNPTSNDGLEDLSSSSSSTETQKRQRQHVKDNKYTSHDKNTITLGPRSRCLSTDIPSSVLFEEDKSTPPNTVVIPLRRKLTQGEAYKSRSSFVAEQSLVVDSHPSGVTSQAPCTM